MDRHALFAKAEIRRFVEIRVLGPVCQVLAPFLLLLAVAVGGATASPPVGLVQASGGDIEVLDTDVEIAFQEAISFTLTAEAQEDITEIRLFYKTIGSNIWSYAYLEFQPNSTVSTGLDLSVAGSDYLPPGTDMEYYFVIRTQGGTIYETSLAQLEYLDNRFTWDRTGVGPLELLYHDVPESRVESVTDEAEWHIGLLTRLLGSQAKKPVKGIIYNRSKEAQEAFPQQSQTITEAQIFGGYAFPAQRLFVGLGMNSIIIVHETAHLLLDQAVGPNAQPLPAWLNEGFASYMEPGATHYSGQSLSTQGLPLTSMSRVPGTPEAINAFYRKSASVIAFLIEEFGVESFQHLIAELRQGRPTGEAMMASYGFDIPGLEARWAADATRPPAPGPDSSRPPSAFINFNTWILGGLALVVIALLLVRSIGRRLRPKSDREEGLQPWEDPDLHRFDDD